MIPLFSNGFFVKEKTGQQFRVWFGYTLFKTGIDKGIAVYSMDYPWGIHGVSMEYTR